MVDSELPLKPCEAPQGSFVKNLVPGGLSLTCQCRLPVSHYVDNIPRVAAFRCRQHYT
jgi:hypothetical protein